MATTGEDFDRGRRVGKYEILTRLSVGGMAELFLAYLPGPGGFKKFVALKQILPDVRRDESFVKMFLDEARITAAFSHPNIAQVFDLGEAGPSRELFLAMELVVGQNLAQVIGRAAKYQRSIPVGFAARVIRDIALGLHYAHHFADPATAQAKPVVHRDVSPKNMMITYSGHVKIIDFGIAKAKGRLNRTLIGTIKGTSGYMSPEQVTNSVLDGRTDLFAAAVMFHELLAGGRLFSAPSDTEMMQKIVHFTPQPLETVNPRVTRALAQVVEQGLEKEPDARFASGRAFARAIETACPELFDDEQVAQLMRELFEDKIELTRSLFEMANQPKADDAKLTETVEGLHRLELMDELARLGKRAPLKGSEAPTFIVPQSQTRADAVVEDDTLPPVPVKQAETLIKPPRPTLVLPPEPTDEAPQLENTRGRIGLIIAVLFALLIAAGWAVFFGPLSKG